MEPQEIAKIPTPPSGREISSTRPNRYIRARNEWQKHVIEEPTLIKSLEASPAVGYILNGKGIPGADAIAKSEVLPMKQGLGTLLYPGTWWIYWYTAASTPGFETYVARPCGTVENLLHQLLLESLAQDVNLAKVGGTSVSAGQTGAEAGFASALIGMVVNARLGALRGATSEYARLYCDTISAITGEGHAAWYWLRAAAAMVGRDTSDNTMRAIEARAFGPTVPLASIYGLWVASKLYAKDIPGGTNTEVNCETPSAFLNGRSASSFQGLWCNALDSKYDVDGAVVAPTAMNRTVRTSTVNPAALAVVGVLDCRGLVHKDLRIDFTAADTARIQVSHDNTTWVTLEDIGGTPAAFAPTTALLLEHLKAWRYVRVLAVAGFVGTAVVTINAMGA